MPTIISVLSIPYRISDKGNCYICLAQESRGRPNGVVGQEGKVSKDGYLVVDFSRNLGTVGAINDWLNNSLTSAYIILRTFGVDV
jgi:hypothetical protein